MSCISSGMTVTVTKHVLDFPLTLFTPSLLHRSPRQKMKSPQPNAVADEDESMLPSTYPQNKTSYHLPKSSPKTLQTTHYHTPISNPIQSNYNNPIPSCHHPPPPPPPPKPAPAPQPPHPQSARPPKSATTSVSAPASFPMPGPASSLPRATARSADGAVIAASWD